MSSPDTLSNQINEGNLFRVSPNPAEDGSATRYWLTEVADASVDPSDAPKGADIYLLQRVGADFVKLAQSGTPSIVLPLSACGFKNI